MGIRTMVERKIGIPVSTSTDLTYNRRSWPMYAAAVRQAGGTPVEIPLNLSTRELATLARECHGVVLPGSPADVDPQRYGQEPVIECSAADHLREQADRLLLEECYRSGKPVLGICYGVQSLNVWRGGSLVQHLPGTPVNHAAGAAVAVAHSAVLRGEGLLSTLVDRTEAVSKSGELRLPVNSSHHQSVEQVGTDLRICAASPEDGVTEAIEGSGSGDSPQFVLGVQWHPERSVETSAMSRAIFKGFFEAVVAWEQLSMSLAPR